MRRAVVLLAAAALLVGCDRGSSYDSGEGPPVDVEWTFPADGEKDVPLRPSIRVQFDRFLAPLAVTRQSICIESATVGSPEAGERCLGNALVAEYDPVDRVGVWTPVSDLLPNTRYNVRILVPTSDDDTGAIRAFDGAPLAGERTFAFVTGDGSKQAVRPNRTIDFCAVAQQSCLLPGPRQKCVPTRVENSVPGPFHVLTGNCTRCHNAMPPHNQSASGAVLHLVTESDIRQLVEQAVVATETATAPDPNVAQRSVRSTFGTNMPYIDAKSPGNSFLIYKMILATPPRCPLRPDEESPYNTPSLCTGASYSSGFSADLYDCAAIPDGGVTADGGCAAPPLTARKAAQGELIPTPVEPWVPEEEWHPPAAGEYARLRQRIRGQPMPPSSGDVAPRNWTRNLSAWIADGAKAPDCPAQ